MSKPISQIPKLVETYFKSCDIDEKVDRFSFFMIRSDGVVLYQNKKNKKDLQLSASVGALLSGVWQASSALSSFIPDKKQDEGYRLSFDTTSQGIYIVPISTEFEDLYLGLIYFEETNPGLIKSKMREMAEKVTSFLNEEFKKIKMKEASLNSKIKTGKAEYLFSNITDAEMDRLFAFVKH